MPVVTISQAQLMQSVTEEHILDSLHVIEGTAMEAGVTQFASARDRQAFLTRYASELFAEFDRLRKAGAAAAILQAFAQRWSFGQANKAIKLAAVAKQGASSK